MKLKASAKKISVYPANIEILTNEYVEVAVDGGCDKVKHIDALYDSNRHYVQVKKFVFVMVCYYATMKKNTG